MRPLNAWAAPALSIIEYARRGACSMTEGGRLHPKPCEDAPHAPPTLRVCRTRSDIQTNKKGGPQAALDHHRAELA
jgi:hypothetical protein